MLLSQGDREAFLAALARAPAAAESEPQLWLYRGLDLEWRGDLEVAAGLYRQAVARNPFVVEYHYRLALAEGRLGAGRQPPSTISAPASCARRGAGCPSCSGVISTRGTSAVALRRRRWRRPSSASPRHARSSAGLRAADACTEERIRAEEGWGG